MDLLHLEDVPGKAQRCFATVGTGVRVFLLSSGKLLNNVPELHSVPISAMLFFRPLRVVVTASKDGASQLLTIVSIMAFVVKLLSCSIKFDY